MSAELQAVSEFVKAFGFPIFVVLLFGYLILIPRRDKVQQRDLSPRLVPGTSYDALEEELAQTRSADLLRAEKAHALCEERINEFRELYRAEKAIASGLQERFREVNEREDQQTKLIKQLTIEIRESRKRNA